MPNPACLRRLSRCTVLSFKKPRSLNRPTGLSGLIVPAWMPDNATRPAAVGPAASARRYYSRYQQDTMIISDPDFIVCAPDVNLVVACVRHEGGSFTRHQPAANASYPLTLSVINPYRYLLAHIGVAHGIEFLIPACFVAERRHYRLVRAPLIRLRLSGTIGRMTLMESCPRPTRTPLQPAPTGLNWNSRKAFRVSGRLHLSIAN